MKFLLLLVSLFGTAQAASILPFRSNFQMSNEPLTTEKIWTIDPSDLNPHRSRWILKRDVDLKDVHATKLHGETGDYYAVESSGLVADTEGYTRAPDSTYFHPMAEFPCTSFERNEPESWFATFEGAQHGAIVASKFWEDLLSENKVKLETKLLHVRGEFPEIAEKAARDIFVQWLADLDQDWRDQSIEKVRQAEWDFYQESAKDSGICRARSNSKSNAKNGKGAKSFARMKTPTWPPAWKSMMEPLRPEAKAGHILAIAPARRWGGLFSVRVSLKIAEHELLGQFLIDSGAPVSVISPSFLQEQGVYPAWIEVPHSQPQKIFWSGGSGFGKPGTAGEVKLSGFSIPIHRFVIHDTDFFEPPESFASCCDGILGADFLRLYAVEVDPGVPNEVRIYPRDGFQLGMNTPWVEASTNRLGELVSACTTQPPEAKSPVLEGVKWDTGDEGALEVFPGDAKKYESVSKHWSLSCEDTTIAKSAAISAQEPLGRVQKNPAVNVGMEILGRGPFTFDLSHGRIWLTEKALDSPIVQNRSGLDLEFVYKDGDRVLKVMSIRPGSPAAVLVKSGLHAGQLITGIDSKPVDSIDQWDVDQHLSGVYGDTVTLQWNVARKNQKIVPFNVKR
jgi:Aspartyl protease